MDRFEDIRSSRKYSTDLLSVDSLEQQSGESHENILSRALALTNLRNSDGWAEIERLVKEINTEAFIEAKKGNLALLDQVKGIDILFEKIDNLLTAGKDYLSQKEEDKPTEE